MEDEQFGVLHEQLRRNIVLAGTRDHVSDVRLFAYYTVIDNEDSAFQQRFPTLSAFLDALQQEFKDHKNGRISTRPLNAKFYAALERLGFSKREWQELRALGQGSVAVFHKKFTIKELENEAFPCDLEPCRPVLLKAARKVDELRKAAEAKAAGSSVSSEDEADFF
ncbi:hypothetical protein Agub_g6059 [Astrephomene gubernaculifera]|uniref:Uncharacterized protein n=1 Tax=Astrephomene gubernaculifera TaxID=47775 RepID=A0AAD3DPU6_9CHLO|nr:hypothetical protein Agub_g6059 [Astrephomene gubernaculifera]